MPDTPTAIKTGMGKKTSRKVTRRKKSPKKLGKKKAATKKTGKKATEKGRSLALKQAWARRKRAGLGRSGSLKRGKAATSGLAGMTLAQLAQQYEAVRAELQRRLD